MRSLTLNELSFVSGGAETTVTVSKGNTSVSVSVKGETKNFGQAMINLYEGAVSATSHVIERVAGVFKGRH